MAAPVPSRFRNRLLQSLAGLPPPVPGADARRRNRVVPQQGRPRDRDSGDPGSACEPRFSPLRDAAAASYLRRGPAGRGRGSGSGCASSGPRACGSGGAGPWHAAEGAGARPHGSCSGGRIRGRKAGFWGAQRALGREPHRSRCLAAVRAARVQIARSAHFTAGVF